MAHTLDLRLYRKLAFERGGRLSVGRNGGRMVVTGYTEQLKFKILQIACIWEEKLWICWVGRIDFCGTGIRWVS